MINLVAPEEIKFNAASDDARSDDLCEPTSAIGIGNPAMQMKETLMCNALYLYHVQ